MSDAIVMSFLTIISFLIGFWLGYEKNKSEEFNKWYKRTGELIEMMREFVDKHEADSKNN